MIPIWINGLELFQGGLGLRVSRQGRHGLSVFVERVGLLDQIIDADVLVIRSFSPGRQRQGQQSQNDQAAPQFHHFIIVIG